MKSLHQIHAWLAAVLLLGTYGASAQIGVGHQDWPLRPPARVVVEPPPPPGPDFIWVEGLLVSRARGHYRWHEGYWTRAPVYRRPAWIGPRPRGRTSIFNGYWGRRSAARFEHRHEWDRGPGTGDRGPVAPKREDHHDDHH